MCIADMAAGRRLAAVPSSATVPPGGLLIAKANPRRLRLIVVPTSGADSFWLSGDTTNATAWFAAISVGYTALPMFRIEEYGQLLMNDVYAVSNTGGNVILRVTELLADAPLDQLIQREVG